MTAKEQEVNFLLTQLNSDQSQIRNAAALRLADLKADIAVNELLKAIFKTETAPWCMPFKHWIVDSN